MAVSWQETARNAARGARINPSNRCPHPFANGVLAFRLHHLDRRTPIGWKDLYQQFGAGYRHMWAWKPKFVQALAEAVSAYPEARVDVEDTHIVLHPSPPPVAKLTGS
jgi:hypothetical protein